MKKLSQFSVDHPITVTMIILGVFLLGYISFSKLGMDLFPDVSNPRLFVEVEAGELPPEEIERKFIESIEALASRQKNVVQVSSSIHVGTALVTVEYSWNTTMDEAFLDLQKALANIKQNDEIDDLLITQYDPNAAPILILALSHPEIGDMDELRQVGESYIRNELIRLEGVADVRLIGQEEKEVVVETDSYMLESFSLTPAEVASKIREFNRNVSGGSIVETGVRYVIKGIGEFGSLDEISEIVVAYRDPAAVGGQVTSNQGSTDSVPVFLSDIATVRFRNKEPDNIVLMNGERCLGLAVYKEIKYNTVQAVEEFMVALERVRKALPGYEITVVENQGRFIMTAIDEVKETLLYGILLAITVLFIFLRRIGVTLVISLAIPISIVATFNLMYFNDLTLNVMTLGGLALGAGMLVDNAIVVMENIFRNLESGLDIRRAAVEGTAQVSGAITASTLTTIVVFLPIVYLHGTAGELFKEQALTVTFSLLSSLVVAILIIPMLTSRIMKTAGITSAGAREPFRWYKNFLRGVLRLRWPVILCSIALVAGAAVLVPRVGSEFIPKTDQREFTVNISLPEGTELSRTAETVDSIQRDITEILGADLRTIFTIIGPSDEIDGSATSLFKDENTATIKLFLADESTISSGAVNAVIDGILRTIPDLEAQFIQEQTALELTLGSDEAPVVVEIRGEDLDTLRDLADQAKEKLGAVDALYNIETSFDEGRPEIDIVLDRVRAGLYNTTIEAVSTQLRNRLLGTEAGEMEDGGEMKDITVELPKLSIGDLDGITIRSGNRDIELYEFADIELTSAPREIIRKNQVRVGKVNAHIRAGTPLDAVVRSMEAGLGDIAFPPDYSYRIGGEERQRREAFDNLKFALILSLALVYMVLASQFESLVHPFTIILSIPLGAVGAVLMFFFLGRPFNIMAYIGIIMLAGIAVNDSIILVDAINRLKGEGLSKIDAIVEAGRRRIRPIVMTSLTTVMALLPLTFGFGEGAALRAPLALAVIGGLVTSTLLTLVVIPCVYSVLDVFSRKKAQDA